MSGRTVPSEVATLEPFVRAGVLGVVEVQVVTTFVRAVAPEAVPHDALLAAALAVRGPLHGHVCVDLATVAASLVPHDEPAPSDTGTGSVVDPDGRGDEGPLDDLALITAAPDAEDGADAEAPTPHDLEWPDAAGWAGQLLDSPLARAQGDEPGALREPLVVAGSSVYLDRFWQDELLVADDLRRRAGADRPADHRAADDRPAEDLLADEGVRAALDRLFPPPGDGSSAGPDTQRLAATAALTHRLAVIAGGPGTGKTRTVARLLAVLVESQAGGGRPPLEIALAAPTGKAAARLSEAVGAEVANAGLDDEVARQLGDLQAVTLHRLLGYRAGGSSFRHHAGNPLTADVVVVDEVSMVSLPLMARLLQAVRPEARLVLVGDPSQLASVEAGAVLGDVVGRRGGVAPAAVAANVVLLDRVYRFGEGSAIAALASAIDRGEADAVVDLLRHGPAGTDGRIRWIEPDDAPALQLVDAEVVEHAAGLVALARSGDAAATLERLRALQVLCATRRGPSGVEHWNQEVDRHLRLAGLVRSRWAPGRPVMVTANDYLNGVFNGDIGVVVRHTEGGRRVQVAFDDVAEPRRIDPSRLDRFETQWAMTIHKSQGSEFTHVVVTLPAPPSPVLTRELLYTAVTRARERVTLVASEAAVRAAVDRPVQRSSGLSARLA